MFAASSLSVMTCCHGNFILNPGGGACKSSSIFLDIHGFNGELRVGLEHVVMAWWVEDDSDNISIPASVVR